MSPELLDLFQQYPLRKSADRVRAASGDLEFALRAYRRQATREGDQGPWEVWMALVKALDLDLDEQYLEIIKKDRRCLVRWLFKEGLLELACRFYKMLIESTNKMYLFPSDNLLYLQSLHSLGRHREVEEASRFIDLRQGLEPPEAFWTALSYIALGQPEKARAIAWQAVRTYHEVGDSWALAALVDARIGSLDQGLAKLQEAARLGVSPDYESELCEAFALSPKDWQALCRKLQLPTPSWDASLKKHLRDPGAYFEMCAGPSPHHFGGADFQMPDCMGCGHPIRQFFLVHLSHIPNLSAKLPSWTKFPFLGCLDCMVSMGRHDYLISGNKVTLKNVAISTKLYGEAYDTLDELPEKPVKLVRTKPLLWPREKHIDALDSSSEQPQIGGSPRWTQAPERPLCRHCRSEMVFVGAMGSTDAFGPRITINNESGYQYHFACDSCRSLSVIAQFT